MLWKSDLEDGTYQNPILFTDYSDPDVIRVGDTFFMTASSFNYVPGLPILVSKDLVNWKVCNYALRRIPYGVYDKPAHGKGIWAPSIRYHDGKYWIFVGMPDEGIFMTNTEDPFGKWSPLVCIKEGKGLIDPCPFWDEDGKAYVIHAYAKSRIGFNSKLGIFPISSDGTKSMGGSTYIYDGTTTQPTIEGPKVYKKNGWYYIFAPAGGVTYGWQTVLRSKFINGPYEEKIVMHQGSTDINGPHQGGLVDTPNGEEWFVHFQDKGVYGRITHLQPVRWENDWPVIGINENENNVGEPVSIYKKPSGCITQKPYEPIASDDFNESKLGFQWQWMANEKEEFYSLSQKKGHLRLYNINDTGVENNILWNYPNVLTQKIVTPSFLAKIALDISNMKKGDLSGVVMLGGEYSYLAIQKDENNTYLRYVVSKEKGDTQIETEIWKQKIDITNGKLEIHILFNENGTAKFAAFSKNDQLCPFTTAFSLDKGTWVGAKIGLFAINSGIQSLGGYTDFDFIHIKRQK